MPELSLTQSTSMSGSDEEKNSVDETASSPKSNKSPSLSKRMKSLVKDGLTRSKHELIKGRHAIEHSLRLGARPNVIPAVDPIYDGDPRPVLIGWHPIGGFAGKWLAERTKLGRWIEKTINQYPDPSQHWAVLVGDYCHELWMDERLDVIYANGPIDKAEWRTFPVGETRLNDEALRREGEKVIAAMREKRPGYNLIDNNCQVFAVNMLKAIQSFCEYHVSTEVIPTSAVVVRTVTGSGKIKDLFSADKPTSPTTSVVSVTDETEPGAQEQQLQLQQQPQTVQVVEVDENGKPVQEGSMVALAKRLMSEQTKMILGTRLF